MTTATTCAQKNTTASIWAQAGQTADSISIRIHGSIDLLYLLKSVFDYSCETFAANPTIASLDVSKVINVHLWPVFIAAAMVAGAFGWLAHCELPKDNHAIKYWLIKKCHYIYPHMRNILSDIKNPRHMIVNWYFIIHGLAHVGAYGVFNPIGIALGGIVMLGMIFYRRMVDRRDLYTKENFSLVKIILAENRIENLDQREKQIKRMKLYERVGGYAAACINGVVDGGYILGCFFALITLGLSSLTCGAPLIAAVTCVAIFSVLSVANYLCKEYEKQKQHNLSVKECDVAIKIKKSVEIKEAIEKALIIEMRPEKEKAIEKLKVLKQYIDTIEKKISFINKTNNYSLAELLATKPKSCVNGQSLAEEYDSLIRQYASIKNKYNEAFNEAFNNKLNTLYHKELKDYINRPSYLDKIFKPFCDTKRAIISCLKNSKAAIEYVLLMFGCSIKSVNASILALVIGVVYSVYLAIKTIYKGVIHIRKKNKSAAKAKALRIKRSENEMMLFKPKQLKRSLSCSLPNPRACRQSSCSF